MVGIVLVSHSRALAEAVRQMMRAMTGPELPVVLAAGAGERHLDLGTNAVEIAEAILSVRSDDGVLVLVDVGSAILSAETALDLIEASVRPQVRLCAGAFVEGAIAAGVTASYGAPLDEVAAEAERALDQKTQSLEARPAAATPAPPPAANGHHQPAAEVARVIVHNEHGLHARPAARLIKETGAFQADVQVRNLTNRRGPVTLRSLSGLASLEILCGHEIEFAARGDDAHGALTKIAALVENGLGEDLPAKKPEAPAPNALRKAAPGAVGLGGGITIGTAVYLRTAKLDIPTHPAADIDAEIERLETAVVATQKAIEARRERLRHTIGENDADIYEAQVIALQDPDLIDRAKALVRDEQVNAAAAWDRAHREIIAHYNKLTDPYLRERAADLEDAGRQVLERLVGRLTPRLSAEASIIIADNLGPQDVGLLDPKIVRGVILLDGGPTAHSAILLRALGVPAVVQARAVFAGVALDAPLPLAFDGSSGQIWLDPGVEFLNGLEVRQAELRRREQEELRAGSLPATTTDGHAIHVFANIGEVAEVDTAVALGAEGVGLLRTEFLFLDRAEAPNEEEQYQALRSIADRLAGKPLIVRTLDAGGDKELPYLHMPGEDNPFLGVRAIRLSFSREEVFDVQLRAILRAGHERDLRVMFPMIASLADLDRAIACLEKAHDDLQREGVPHLWPVPTGIMIEIPSAALQAEAMARRADFFSIGTNDLTQYTLAADRGNPGLALYQDALHPSVLRLISMVVEGARKHQRHVAVCGEAAADERAAAVFVGLGVRELSLTGAKIPHIKAFLRRHSVSGMRKLAYSALHCHTPAEVRGLKPAA
jgi:phosphocarrier protein FPr